MLGYASVYVCVLVHLNLNLTVHGFICMCIHGRNSVLLHNARLGHSCSTCQGEQRPSSLALTNVNLQPARRDISPVQYMCGRTVCRVLPDHPHVLSFRTWSSVENITEEVPVLNEHPLANKTVTCYNRD